MVPENVLIPTYTVVSRHSAKCPYKAEGRSYVKCGCRKHIAVYDPSKDLKVRQSIIKTRTRSWQDAERIAQAYRKRLTLNCGGVAQRKSGGHQVGGSKL